MNLKPNKSPEHDGLTNEFYFDKKEMSFSQRLAVMSFYF